jgi:hypothetical protein
MTLENTTEQQWGRKLILPTDSLQAQKLAHTFANIQIKLIFIDGETITVCESSTYKGAYELFGDVVAPWRISNPKALIKYLVDSKDTWWINSIDAPTSGDFFGTTMQVPTNLLDVKAPNFQFWLDKKEKRHRKRIKENLEASVSLQTRRIGPEYAKSEDFSRLLIGQADYLQKTVWVETYDEECITHLAVVWMAWVRAIAQAPELNPQCWVGSLCGRDIACTVTCTINDRRFFIITLTDHGLKNAGLAVRAKAVKDSVDDPSINWVDMMVGNSYHKRVYEPDLSHKTHLLTVHPTRFWEDPTAEIELMPNPPFIADGKLYTLHSQELNLE